MAEQTETEKKIAEIIISLTPQAQPFTLKKVKLQIIYNTAPTGKKIMLIKMPYLLLEALRSTYFRFVKKVSALFPDYVVLAVRSRKIVSLPARKKRHVKVKYGSMKAHVHESWIQDLCYPVLVEGRMSEVRSSGRTECAALERKCDYDSGSLRAMEVAYKALTGKNLVYSIRYY